jgi:FkbM family methyltransferase
MKVNNRKDAKGNIVHQILHSVACCCWYLVQGVSQVAIVVVLGFGAGLFLAILRKHSNGTIRHNAHQQPNSLTAMMVQDSAARNNQDGSTGCVLPLGTTRIVVRSGMSTFALVVYDDDFLSNQIAKRGYWEIEDVDDMAALTPSLRLPPPVTAAGKTTTFYDIGANVGYYSFLFAAAGYTVIAFEPETRNAALFRASLCLNQQQQGTPPSISSRITLFEMAVSNEEEAAAGKCQLIGRSNQRTRKYLQSIPQLVCTTNTKCQRDDNTICQTSVPVTTLDRFVTEHEKDVSPPDIVKIDVEGHERQVLEGMLHMPKPASVIQYENKDGRIEATLESMLTAAGYTVGKARGHDANTIAEYTRTTTSAA